MNLSLGTVQFGTDYGITNQSGQTPFEEVARILQFAKGKINILDTAPGYGTSEKVLGENRILDFNIVTKTPHIKSETIGLQELEKVENCFFQSLESLKIPSVYGLLIHNPNDMFKEGSDKLFKKISDLKQKGFVKKIGVSVYTQSDIEGLCKKYNFDIVQVPLNVLDQRLVKSGTLKNLKERGIEIHARSIFLQGILLNDISVLDNRFTDIVPILKDYFSELKINEINKVEGALSFINSLKEIDQVIIGVNNLEQLKEIYHSYLKIKSNSNINIDFSKYVCERENIIDPRKW